MKKFIKKFPWYVLFSVFTFVVLIFVPLPKPKKESHLMRHFCFVSVVFIFLPTYLAVVAARGLQLIPEFIGTASIPGLTFYISGIFAAYKHVEWRRKQMKEPETHRDEIK